jgi:hypothetical protein
VIFVLVFLNNRLRIHSEADSKSRLKTTEKGFESNLYVIWNYYTPDSETAARASG